MAHKLSLPNGKLLTWIAGMFSFVLLFAMLATSPSELRYDEKYHLSFTDKVASEGWREALLDPANPSAAGPLYPALHLVWGYVSRMEAPGVRWLNFALLVGATLLIGLTRPNLSNAATISCAAFSIMAVPFLWTPAGLALTELPALTAFSGFILSLGRSIASGLDCSERGRGEAVFYATVAGALLGVAILGRQTYLVALPALIIMVIAAPKLWLQALASSLAAILVSAWLFVVWGGLVPPSQARMDSGIQPIHGLMSLAYLAAATAFISPRFLLPSSYRVAGLALVAGNLMAVLLSDHKNLPAGPLLGRLLGEEAALFAGLFALGGMFSVGLVWLWNLPICVWKKRADPFQIVLASILLALALSPIKITSLFSSRYLVGMLGVLILVLQPAATPWLAVRIVAGSLVGAATLYMKYHP